MDAPLDSQPNPIWQTEYDIDGNELLVVELEGIKISFPANLDLSSEKITAVNDYLKKIAAIVSDKTEISSFSSLETYFPIPDWLNDVQNADVKKFIDDVCVVGEFNSVHKSLLLLFARACEFDRLAKAIFTKPESNDEQTNNLYLTYLKKFEDLIRLKLMYTYEEITKSQGDEARVRLYSFLKNEDLNLKALVQKFTTTERIYMYTYELFYNWINANSTTGIPLAADLIFPEKDSEVYREIAKFTKENFHGYFIMWSGRYILSIIRDKYSHFNYPNPLATMNNFLNLNSLDDGNTVDAEM